MCVAILKPNKSTIDNKTIKQCWKKNPHGGGFMYVRDGKIVIIKELSKVDNYIKLFREHEKFFNGDVVLHFRIATSGETDLINTHPHKVNNNIYMVHNGIIERCEDINSKFSDTINFCTFISNLPNSFMKNDSILELISGYINNDKMIFLNRDNEVKIINESLGMWIGGNWFSNNHWQETQKFNLWNHNNYETRIVYNDNKKHCIECEYEIGKYESNQYNGLCYSCFQLSIENDRFYGEI